jgi:hypothetical protein
MVEKTKRTGLFMRNPQTATGQGALVLLRLKRTFRMGGHWGSRFLPMLMILIPSRRISVMRADGYSVFDCVPEPGTLCPH